MHSVHEGAGVGRVAGALSIDALLGLRATPWESIKAVTGPSASRRVAFSASVLQGPMIRCNKCRFGHSNLDKEEPWQIR
jgi:hypothetical protein